MEWRDIPGFEGAYQVSDTGAVRSLPRRIVKRNRYGGQHECSLKGRLLTPVRCTNGYMAINLTSDTKRQLVHRLVALAFIPGDSSLQVNHKNGCRDDNRVSNLEWLSCSDNHRHSHRELNRKQHALTKPVWLVSTTERRWFESILAAANELGVSAGSVASAASRNHRCRGYEVIYG